MPLAHEPGGRARRARRSGLRARHLLLDELHVLAHDRIELLDLQLLRLGALVLRGVVVVAGACGRHQADELTHHDPPWGPAVLAEAHPKATASSAQLGRAQLIACAGCARAPSAPCSPR